MKIMDRLRKVQLAVLNDKVNGTGTLGEKAGEAALAALNGGLGSEPWKNYMSLFADSAEQLTRLSSAELDAGDQYLPRIRAYIVANGICAPGTDLKTVNGTRNFAPQNGGDIDRPKAGNSPLSEAVDGGVVARRAAALGPLADLV